MTNRPSPALDERWMRLALGLAARGLGNTWPNPAVGCVLVKDGLVIGRGWSAERYRSHVTFLATGALTK